MELFWPYFTFSSSWHHGPVYWAWSRAEIDLGQPDDAGAVRADRDLGDPRPEDRLPPVDPDLDAAAIHRR